MCIYIVECSYLYMVKHMKKMEKIGHFMIVAVAVALLLPQALAGSMGFGPTEIIGSNKRDTLIVGTASLINGYDVDKYGVLSLVIPYINQDTWQPVPNEQRNIRVICRSCGESMVRYEAIKNYSYPNSPLIGMCEKCNSEDLIFYELIPRDEFQQMSLEGAGAFELRKEGNSYITTEKIPSGATCNINVLYNASKSYLKENEGKYWEVRVKATLRESLEGVGVGVVAGIGIRTLIEFKLPLFIVAPDIIEKGKEFTVKVTCGNFEGTWREMPDNVMVSFFGETKPIDATCYVTFTAPVTRENYSYDIVAKGAKYLSDVKTVVTGDALAGGNTDGTLPTSLFIGVGIVLLVVASIAVGYGSYRYKYNNKHEKSKHEKSKHRTEL